MAMLSAYAGCDSDGDQDEAEQDFEVVLDCSAMGRARTPSSLMSLSGSFGSNPALAPKSTALVVIELDHPQRERREIDSYVPNSIESQRPKPEVDVVTVVERG